MGVFLVLLGLGLCILLYSCVVCSGINRSPEDDEEQLKYLDRWAEIHRQQKRNKDGMR